MRIAVGGIVHWRKSVPAWLDHLARLDAGAHELVPIFEVDGRDGSEDVRAAVYRVFPDAVLAVKGGATAGNA